MENLNSIWSPTEALFLLKSKTASNNLSYSSVRSINQVNRHWKADFKFNPSKNPTSQLVHPGFIHRGTAPSINSFLHAMNTARHAGIDIQYEKGSGERLPYTNECFEAVFCMDVLQEVENGGKLFSEIFRVLKPGGVLYFDLSNTISLPLPLELKAQQERIKSKSNYLAKHKWGILIKPISKSVRKQGIPSLLESTRLKINQLLPSNKMESWNEKLKKYYAYTFISAVINVILSEENKLNYRSYSIVSSK